MGNYEELKAAVSSVIKTNGNQEITGQVLQNTLTTLISQVGANATFAGIATPDTAPGTPDQNVFYIAGKSGTYVNFDNIVIPEGKVAILSNKNGYWVRQYTYIAAQKQVTKLYLKQLIKEMYVPNIDFSELKIITVNLAYQTGGIWYNAIYFKRADNSLIRVIIEEQYNTKEEAISSWNIGIKTFPYGYMFIGEEITDTITEEITDYYDVTNISYSPILQFHINSRFVYLGIADKNTIPDRSKENVYYIAITPGEYPNFNLAIANNEIANFKYAGSNWIKETITYFSGISNNPIFNLFVRELYLTNTSIVNCVLRLNYQTGGKYYNNIYGYNSSGNVTVLWEESFDTLEESNNAIYGLHELRNSMGYILLNNGNSTTYKHIEVTTFNYDISDMNNSPVIKSNIIVEGVTTDGKYNKYIKELYVPNIDINNITTITLNIARYVGGLYYNSLYVRRADGGTTVVYDENFTTLEEAISNCMGIKGSSNGYALINGHGDSKLVNEPTLAFNNPLTLDFCPNINLYLNLKTNILFGKKIIWDGDSIAADNEWNSTGWRTRIQIPNNMVGVNYSRGGSTFTSNLDGLDVIYNMSMRIDTIISEQNDCDYFVFDGGTNDADRIGRIVAYNADQTDYVLIDRANYPAKFGSWNNKDFSGNYDINTYCGAIESYIYKILNKYKGKKIGFIIAPKMGTTSLTFFNKLEYFKEAIRICQKWGIPYIDLWRESWMNPNLPNQWNNQLDKNGNVDAGNFYLDGQHPAPNGYDYISKLINNWINNL